MELLAVRLGRAPDHDLDCTDDILNIDDAAKSLEREDEERLKSEQRGARSKREFREEFAKTYRVAREKVQRESAKQQKKTPASRGKSGRPKSLPSSMTMMPQSAAKAYMPHDGYLWRSNNDASWHSKVGAFPTCNRSVAKHGGAALKMVVSDAWHKHCLLHGISLSACPMAGLLPEGAVSSDIA